MNMLSVAGFDPSGASGIQRDARVAYTMGFYPLSVVTAITAQSTSGFVDVHAVEPATIQSQIEEILSDFDVHALKVGMVWSAETIRVIQKTIHVVDAPMVVDPVVSSTTGGQLLKEDARDALVDLCRGARVITPNVREAAYLSGMDVRDVSSAADAASTIRGDSDVTVIVTGVVRDRTVLDVIYEQDATILEHPLQEGESRGGGCAYSATLSCLLASGRPIQEAADVAAEVSGRLTAEPSRPGAGLPVAADQTADQLAAAIEMLHGMEGMHALIPECQSNFVFAPKDATRPDEVLGISGRLVRTSNSIMRAGAILPGGSHHVASAVCAMRGRFAGMRAAINIRFSAAILAAMVREGMVVCFYDRSEEPTHIKESGSTISWGITEAISDAAKPPDVVCHRGDFGKEPMSIVFGETPESVLHKLSQILK